MHVLYVHQNFPAQFGHIALHLARRQGWKCTFVSETPAGNVEGIEKIQYSLAGGATKASHFCSRTFENTVWHCDAVYNALKARPDLKPDLIVGHSGFGSTLFLRELYRDVPVVNLFEYYYHAHESDMDFRKDLAWELPDIKYLRSYCRNAMIMLDLQNCQVGYCPTEFQRSRFPQEYQGKLQTLFDGVDRGIYQGYNENLRLPPGQRGNRTIAGIEIDANTRVVTYVSRGFESMRGFDIFMRSAKLIAQQYPNVAFIVVGTDRIAYGGDQQYIDGKQSFKEWVLSKDEYDLTKFHFVGRLEQAELARVLASTDLHLYLTVPFVLSWSMVDAMSCGAVVLGSNTAPVREVIKDGANGLLADFFNPEQFAEKAVAVLKDPAAYRPLGRAAEQLIAQRYSLDAVLPRHMRMYEDTVNRVQRMAVPPVQAMVETALNAGDVLTAVKPRARSPFRG